MDSKLKCVFDMPNTNDLNVSHTISGTGTAALNNTSAAHPNAAVIHKIKCHVISFICGFIFALFALFLTYTSG